MKKVKAFTLIELLVVIVIIGILAALIVLSLTTARSKARDARAKSAVSDTATAVEMYINDNENLTAYPAPGSVGEDAKVNVGRIGTLLKSDALDGLGEPVKYKIKSPTEYVVVGEAANSTATARKCWYTSSNWPAPLATAPNNISSTTPSSNTAICTLAD